jgi:lipid-A-disaccharide synthase
MRSAGVEILFPIEGLGVMGVVEVLKRWTAIRAAYRAMKEAVGRLPLRGVVLIDHPEFNLRLAQVCRDRGVPVVYYVSPKVWAWRKGRIKTIRSLVSHMLLIFPFEEPLYREEGIPCTFVGHPIVDEVPDGTDRNRLRREWGLPEKAIIAALLPGSRREEMNRLLPMMLEAAAVAHRRVAGLQFVLPVADSLPYDEVAAHAGSAGIPICVLKGHAPEALAGSDAAVVASGTATLEAALADVPSVVVYRMHPVTYRIAKGLVRLRYVSPVNLLADREVYPELIQAEATARNTADRLVALLTDRPLRDRMRKDLREVRDRLGRPGVSDRAAAQTLNVFDHGQS